MYHYLFDYKGSIIAAISSRHIHIIVMQLIVSVLTPPAQSNVNLKTLSIHSTILTLSVILEFAGHRQALNA